VLVDLSGRPKVLGTLTPSGDYVDARLVGSTVRLVTRSQPTIVVPQPGGAGDGRQQLARASAAVRRAPISAWRPTYQLRDADGTTWSRTCRSVSHPADYTGTSLLTIGSIDPAAGLNSVSTVSLASDGDTVYATTSSLYIASNPQWWYAPAQVPMVAPNSRPPWKSSRATPRTTTGSCRAGVLPLCPTASSVTIRAGRIGRGGGGVRRWAAGDKACRDLSRVGEPTGDRVNERAEHVVGVVESVDLPADG
jgi:hypothetical protein